MPRLTTPAIRRAIERSYELWNAEDKAGWLQHWQALTPGDHLLEDPIGTPPKAGWDLLEQVWDRTSRDRLYVTAKQIIVCGNEGVAVCDNAGTVKGRPVLIESVDLYRFGDDGSTHVRSFWEIPDKLPYGEWDSRHR